MGGEGGPTFIFTLAFFRQLAVLTRSHKMKFGSLSKLIISLSSLALLACGKGGDDGGSQVVPYPPGTAYYNCLPGQPCGGTNLLVNNFGQPLTFSGPVR